MRRTLNIIVFILFVSAGYGQSRDNNWLFGDFGWVDFNGGSSSDNGLGQFFGNEGVASVSDKFGNLLFSSNGESVFDKNGNLMPNSSYLHGHTSSTQGVLIVPKPGDFDERYFYIFTASAEMGKYTPGHTGLEYVIVDMSLNSGLGDIAAASIQLVPNTGEKLHATWHSNKRDVWVVTHSMNSSDYHAFLITCNGIEDHVISKTGSVHNNTTYGEGCIGALKLSPDGKRVACTHNDMLQPGSTNLVNYLEIGEFNDVNGQITVTDGIIKDHNGPYQSYGVEFSPDNTKLYWSIMSSPSLLYQYDLLQPALTGETVVGTTTSHAFGGLQLGPNGKIYSARTHNAGYLSLIDNPNLTGSACGFIDQGLAITSQCRFGLPNQWMFPYPVPENNVDSVLLTKCPNGEIQFSAPSAMGTNIIWSNGEKSESITVSDFGTYWVRTTECIQDTTFFEITEEPFCVCELFVPNSFTPNGDGTNDFFGGVSWCDLQDFEFRIYNRWGEVIFKSTDVNQQWDGRYAGNLSPDGVYVWHASWKDPFVKGIQSNQKKTGHLVLTR